MQPESFEPSRKTVIAVWIIVAMIFAMMGRFLVSELTRKPTPRTLPMVSAPIPVPMPLQQSEMVDVKAQNEAAYRAAHPPEYVPGHAPTYSEDGYGGYREGGSVSVRGYTRKDGTYVRPHTRRSPRRR